VIGIEFNAQDYADAQSWLEKIAVTIGSSEAWEDRLDRLGVAGVEYARSISPVVTGSYRESHMASVSGLILEIGIDPGAVNSRTGIAVSKYAGFVEEMHSVYGQTEDYVDRIAADVLESLAQEIDAI